MGSDDIMRLGEAWQVYLRITKSPSNGNTKRRFFKFLTLPEEEKVSQDLFLPEIALQRINWLCGPNAEVMYKIWKAKHAPDA